MKKISTLVFLAISVYSHAQTMCGTVGEGGQVTLTAPPGNVFTSIEFASYGTPNGSCGSFTIGACHASNSVSISGAIFIGQNSAVISATNGVFGDPCGGTPKRFYIEARYSSTLPLTLISFTAKKAEEGKVKLDWLSANEINTSGFIVEKSADGISFSSIGAVNAIGNNGHNYSFIDIISRTISVYYYRLKMIDRDGKYQYSNTIRINNGQADAKLMVFPNVSDKLITILSNRQQEAIVTDYTGQVIKKILLANGNTTLNITEWSSGVYIIKTEETSAKFIKQ